MGNKPEVLFRARFTARRFKTENYKVTKKVTVNITVWWANSPKPDTTNKFVNVSFIMVPKQRQDLKVSLNPTGRHSAKHENQTGSSHSCRPVRHRSEPEPWRHYIQTHETRSNTEQIHPAVETRLSVELRHFNLVTGGKRVAAGKCCFEGKTAEQVQKTTFPAFYWTLEATKILHKITNHKNIHKYTEKTVKYQNNKTWKQRS